MRQADVTKYRGNVYVDIREQYMVKYACEGVHKPAMTLSVCLNTSQVSVGNCLSDVQLVARMQLVGLQKDSTGSMLSCSAASRFKRDPGLSVQRDGELLPSKKGIALDPVEFYRIRQAEPKISAALAADDVDYELELGLQCGAAVLWFPAAACTACIHTLQPACISCI